MLPSMVRVAPSPAGRAILSAPAHVAATAANAMMIAGLTCLTVITLTLSLVHSSLPQRGTPAQPGGSRRWGPAGDEYSLGARSPITMSASSPKIRVLGHAGRPLQL